LGNSLPSPLELVSQTLLNYIGHYKSDIAETTFPDSTSNAVNPTDLGVIDLVALLVFRVRMKSGWAFEEQPFWFS
jgi:hypothetical protein